MNDLRDQTAVITGGGRGLGRAFALALAAAGAKVIVIARSESELEEAVGAIGNNARAFCGDVIDAARMGEIFAQIGPIDVLVNNAGVLGPIGPFVESEFEDWWRAIEVNVRGAMLCAHFALPRMIAGRGGRIINIVTGPFSPAYLSGYVAAKTAMVRASECLAVELKPHGIAVFSVAPGTVKTAMTDRSLYSPEGQRWIPWFKRYFDEGLTLPPERPATLIAALASGKYDTLSGLYLSPFDDLDALVANLDQVRRDQLHVLQIRPQKVSEQAAALAAIRDLASCART